MLILFFFIDLILSYITVLYMLQYTLCNVYDVASHTQLDKYCLFGLVDGHQPKASTFDYQDMRLIHQLPYTLHL